jgi:acetoin utilization protein AcuB
MAVKRYMTANPITVQPDESILHARALLRSHQIRHLPVVERKRLIGMLSDRDIRLLLPSSLATAEEQQRFHSWGAQVTVGDVMTRKVVTVAPETETEKAARLMVEHRIGCLPVLRGSILIGIITTIDLLQAMIEKPPSPPVRPAKTSAGRRKTAASRRVPRSRHKRTRRP